MKPNPYSHFPPSKIPADVIVNYISAADLIDEACHQIIKRAQSDPQSFLVAGISIRFDVEPDGYGGLVSKLQNHPAVNIIQLAIHKEVYVFQVTELQEKASAPPNLLSLLSSNHIIKVGHSISETLLHLANLWSIDGLKS